MFLPLGDTPRWFKHYGKDVLQYTRLLDNLYNHTMDVPLEERNKLFRIVVEDIMTMRNRFIDLDRSETDEAFALCSKYNHPETGLCNALFREYETYITDLETRYPLLARLIKEDDEYCPTLVKYSAKVFAREGQPTIMFSHGIPPKGFRNGLVIKGLEAIRDHLIKKSNLLEEQNQILTRTLEENGIAIPRESTAIKSKVDSLMQSSPDDPTQAEGPDQKTGERRDPCPIAKPAALIENSTGPSFNATFEVVEGKKFVLPPPKIPYVPRLEMEREQLQELLKSMHRFNCGKFFETPITKDKSIKYFELVKEHRDLVSIKNELDKGPQYRCAEQFFNDIRIMLDNCTHVFGKESDEHKMAERFEEVVLKKLEDYGEAGQTAKVCELPAVGLYQFPGVSRAYSNRTPQDQLASAPRAEFNEIAPSPKADEPISPSAAHDQIDDSDDPDEAETSFAQGVNDNYNDDYGDGRDDSFFGRNDDVLDYGDEHDTLPQTPATVGPSRKPGSQDGHANQSPSIHGPAEQSGDEDELVKQAWGVFDVAKQYDRAHGNATRAPAGRGTTQPHDDEDGRDSPAPGASGPAEQPDGSDSDILSSIASPSPPPAAQLETTAGNSGDEAAHTGSHAPEQPVPFAPMHVEQEIIDLTSSPQRQTSHVDSASAKRGRESDDQESSSDDDAPLIKRRKTTVQPSSDDVSPPTKRRKSTAEPSSDGNPPPGSRQKTAAAESALYAVTPSLGKRSRDDDDSDDGEEREQPLKKSKASSLSAPEPLAPVTTAAGDAGDAGHETTSLTIDELFEPFQSPPRPALEPQPPVAAAAPVGDFSPQVDQDLLSRVRNAEVPPSPIPEPLTPTAAAADGPGSVSPPLMLAGAEAREPANDASDMEGHESSSSSAAADEPQSEPATEDLGHTNNGTITASKLHKLPKYKRKGRSKERGPPNRPWVFGYRFGNDYGLYIMSCPEKGCETGTEIFTYHPLMRNTAAIHLQECGHDFADDDDMVRKFCTQGTCLSHPPPPQNAARLV